VFNTDDAADAIFDTADGTFATSATVAESFDGANDDFIADGK
jgi:hypothetical protein